jgi:ComF family protein
VAFQYQDPGDAVIRGLKFGRLEYLGAELAERLADHVRPWIADLCWVVPVPLHWSRRLARGYNQAERIARPLAARLGLPCVAALQRRRWTPPQTSLARADRSRSQRRSLRLAPGVDVRGGGVLLVDDVTTTGATLRAAAAELRRAGASRILAAVAARTPGADERAPGSSPRA